MSYIQLLQPFNGYSPGRHDFGDSENARLVSLGLASAYVAPSSPFSLAYVGPFASFPAASSVPGDIAAATDLGAQAFALLRSNGSVWRPVGPVMLSSFFSAAGQTVAAAAAETKIGTEFMVPGGLVQPGDVLRVMVLSLNGGADGNTRSLRARISAAAGTAVDSATLMTLFSTANASNVSHQLDKLVHVLASDTVVIGAQTSASTASTAFATVTLPALANNTYWNFSALPSSSQNWVIHQMAIQLIPGV